VAMPPAGRFLKKAPKNFMVMSHDEINDAVAAFVMFMFHPCQPY